MDLDFTIVIDFLKQNPLIAIAVIFLVMWKNGGETNVLDMIVNFIKGLFTPKTVSKSHDTFIASPIEVGNECHCEEDATCCIIAAARYCSENGKDDVAEELYDLLPSVLKAKKEA